MSCNCTLDRNVKFVTQEGFFWPRLVIENGVVDVGSGFVQQSASEMTMWVSLATRNIVATFDLPRPNSSHVVIWGADISDMEANIRLAKPSKLRSKQFLYNWCRIF